MLADIGDEQSLQQNLSTFSGHIRRIARILAALSASEDPARAGSAARPVGASLVLLDEVGAGTDPTEGAALAAALLRHLAEKARLTIATTHFGELKALKSADPRFEKASVAFDVEPFSPTYLPSVACARRLGDRVRLLALGKAAEVLAISREGTELSVHCGVLRSTVELAAIEGLHGLQWGEARAAGSTPAWGCGGLSATVMKSKSALLVILGCDGSKVVIIFAGDLTLALWPGFVRLGRKKRNAPEKSWHSR